MAKEKELKNETIAEILERHYNSVNSLDELSLGDLENDIEYKINQALDEQRKEILEMIKFDKGDLPLCPSTREKIKKDPIGYALMIIKANINYKYGRTTKNN